MKKFLVPILALALCVGVVGVTQAAKPTTTTYTFVSQSGYNVTGTVTVRELPNGRTLVRVQAEGLEPGTRFAISYSSSTGCTEGSGERTLLERVTTSSRGSIMLNKHVTNTTTIGSVSLRTDDGITLVACAS